MYRLFITSQCPNCAAMIQLVSSLVKHADIPNIEIINIEAEQTADIPAIRSVPTLEIDTLLFTGVYTKNELDPIINGFKAGGDYHQLTGYLLANGQLNQVEKLLEAHPEAYPGLMVHIANPESPMQVRVGVAAILESIPESAEFQRMSHQLLELSYHKDDRIRTDAAYFLTLCNSEKALKRLHELVDDPNHEVAEIAKDAIHP